MSDIVLKNANGTPVVYNGVTKIKVPTSDGGTTIYTEGASGGGIEEVTELPEATAENVGKIYKYQGQLYECKEILDMFVTFENTFSGIYMYNYLAKLNNFSPDIKKYSLDFIDKTPTLEDVKPGVLHHWVARDFSNMWFFEPETGEIISMLEEDEEGYKTIIKVFDSYNVTQELEDFIDSSTDHIAHMPIIHYYDNEPISTSSLGFTYKELICDTFIVPKRCVWVLPFQFALSLAENFIFNGSLASIHASAFFRAIFIKTIDLSNCVQVPELVIGDIEGDTTVLADLSEIKVPQALLEEFKSATNWSEYADLMVGV